MPSPETYKIKPIRELLSRYVQARDLVVDPFARNSKVGNRGAYRNDLDPSTTAEFHMDAVDFLEMLKKEGIIADIILLDPPYSAGQSADHYKGNRCLSMTRVREAAHAILRLGGIVISFGWDSCGMGMKDYYEFVEIMLVAHGGTRHDTIVTVQRKTAL